MGKPYKEPTCHHTAYTDQLHQTSWNFETHRMSSYVDSERNVKTCSYTRFVVNYHAIIYLTLTAASVPSSTRWWWSHHASSGRWGRHTSWWTRGTPIIIISENKECKFRKQIPQSTSEDVWWTWKTTQYKTEKKTVVRNTQYKSMQCNSN